MPNTATRDVHGTARGRPDFRGARRVRTRPVLLEIITATDTRAFAMPGDDEAASATTHLLTGLLLEESLFEVGCVVIKVGFDLKSNQADVH